MIFLTLGTQLPFDRLVRAVDEIAPDLDEPVFGQIGRTGYVPANFDHEADLSPSAFDRHLGTARVIVGHAGIGTILAGRKLGKPLILMPRRAQYNEHRNDHQMATAEQVGRFEGVHIVHDADAIRDLLQRADLTPMSNTPSATFGRLIGALRVDIFGPAPEETP